MVDRVDALGRDSKHIEALAHASLDESIDEQLQQVVHQAAGELGTPIALVSLVLDRLQFFQAHVGLPEDLADARATDRDVSFCQFVVRDGAPFVVHDTTNDTRVPKNLVQRFGIRAYLGVPVRARGETVGSLCVMDLEPHRFSEAQSRRLSTMADTVSYRLAELWGAQRGRALLSRATAPAFAELRNLLSPLRALTTSARVSSFELGVLTRVGDAAGEATRGALSEARTTLAELGHGLGLLEGVAVRIQEQIVAIENIALSRGAEVTVTETIEGALRLAHHHTKLAGGVHTTPMRKTLRLATTRVVAVATLSTALSAIAIAMAPADQGLRLSVVEDEFTVVLTIGANLSEPQLATVRQEVSLLGGFDPTTAIHVDRVGLHLGFARAVEE